MVDMIPRPDPSRILVAAFAAFGPHLRPVRFDTVPAGKVMIMSRVGSADLLSAAAAGYRELLAGEGEPAAGYLAESWRWLAEDCHRLAERAAERLTVEISDDPEPYPDPASMLADIRRGRFIVSRANSDHPIWSEDDNVAFRIAHDCYGHALSGGDFSWHGEILACSTHAPLIDPRGYAAMACECIAQTGYAIASGKFADRQVCGTTPAIAEIPSRLWWL